jgi:predicted P-loop ATPase
VDALTHDRDQLWAEAKERFDAGAVWWMETAELIQMASDQQIDRYEGDPWEEVIAPWLEGHLSVSISEVLEKCLQKAHALWTRTDKNPRGPLPEGVGLGAIPGTPRLEAGMAVQEE